MEVLKTSTDVLSLNGSVDGVFGQAMMDLRNIATNVSSCYKENLDSTQDGSKPALTRARY